MSRSFPVILCSLYFVVGCQAASKSQLPQSATEGGFTAAAVPEASPHLYAVELKWDSPVPQIIHRVGPGDEEAMHLTEEGETSYRDGGLRHGTYTYTLGHLPPRKVVIPRDRVLDAPHVVSHVQGIGRLFLGSGAELISDGQDLTIEVDALISDGARIRAFGPGRTTTQAGRHGGKLLIRAKWAEGTLHVDRSGEDGGPGLKGAAGADGARGEPGSNAQVHLTRYVMEDAREMAKHHGERLITTHTEAHVERLLQQKGAGHPDVAYYFACDRPAQSGSRGGKGGTGQDGSPGFAGGDMMAVDIRVENSHDWQVFLTGEPGKGGAGGEAGPGGVGGPGGPPGARDRYGVCPFSATAGPTGPVGDAGKKGPPGREGRRTPFCIQSGNQKEGSCGSPS